MPTLKVEVALDSDAMVTEAQYELARMFQKVADNFTTLSDPNWNQMNLFDSNGNNVGQVWIEED
jgi:hypothetical protein